MREKREKSIRVNFSNEEFSDVEFLQKELRISGVQELIRHLVSNRASKIRERVLIYGNQGIKKQTIQERMNEKVFQLNETSAEKVTEYLQSISYDAFTPYDLDLLDQPLNPGCFSKVHHQIVDRSDGRFWERVEYNMNDPLHKITDRRDICPFSELAKDLKKKKLI